MTKCDFNSYVAGVNALKKVAPIKITNFFLDSNEARTLFEKNPCYLLQDCHNAIFILKPFHNGIYNIIYQAHDLEALKTGAESLPRYLPLCISVIGNAAAAEKTAAVFAETGFREVKKLQRSLSKGGNARIMRALKILAEPYADNFDFAAPEEAEDVLEFLLTEFDPVGDSLPTLEEIRDAAARKWISVIRLDGGIAALSYITMRGHIVHGLYSLTRPQYRKGGSLFAALAYYWNEHLKKIHPEVKRTYGWQDCKNTSLIKKVATINQASDGIFIHNMFREPVMS